MPGAIGELAGRPAARAVRRAHWLAIRATDDGRVLCPRVRVARSFWARLVGLIGRRSLEPDEGLLMSGSSVHMLFMRFPIDCLFLGRRAADGTRPVVGLRSGLRPWTGLAWQRGASLVIELPVGVLQRSAVQRGDVVRLEDVAAPTR